MSPEVSTETLYMVIFGRVNGFPVVQQYKEDLNKDATQCTSLALIADQIAMKLTE